MVYYVLSLFLGYVLGRVGHIIGGDISWVPHHWIVGLVIIIIPLFLKKVSKRVKIIIILFGLGVFISDFNDFLQLKTFQNDNASVVRFWGVD